MASSTNGEPKDGHKSKPWYRTAKGRAIAIVSALVLVGVIVGVAVGVTLNKETTPGQGDGGGIQSNTEGQQPTTSAVVTTILSSGADQTKTLMSTLTSHITQIQTSTSTLTPDLGPESPD